MYERLLVFVFKLIFIINALLFYLVLSVLSDMIFVDVKENLHRDSDVPVI